MLLLVRLENEWVSHLLGDFKGFWKSQGNAAKRNTFFSCFLVLFHNWAKPFLLDHRYHKGQMHEQKCSHSDICNGTRCHLDPDFFSPHENKKMDPLEIWSPRKLVPKKFGPQEIWSPRSLVPRKNGPPKNLSNMKEI